MNKFKCLGCGGEGGIVEKRHGILAEYKCDTCHCSGFMCIAVCVPPTHDGGTGYYRPLTEQEVEEMVLTEITLAHPELMLNKSVRELMIKQTMEMQIKGEINLTYKKQPCKLIPA